MVLQAGDYVRISEGNTIVAQWDGADGIDDLAARLPAARVKEFPTASHSIHNTNADEFVADLCAIVDRCR